MEQKRGAPVGNKNAFKHGFYSASFRQREQQILDDNIPADLADEISLVRVAIARCLAALESNPGERDIATELAILRTINLGALSINSLVRTRLMLARGLELFPSEPMTAGDTDAPDASPQDKQDTPFG